MCLVWDKKRFLEEVEQDLGLAAELVNLFRRSSQELLQAMETALACKDIPTLKQKAHSLKGAAGTIYLESVRQKALTLEREALVAKEYAKILSEIRELCAIFEKEARKLLSD